LFGFAGDQVEVRGHIELRTTFSNGTSTRTINIRYIVVNAFSAYNFLLGRPSLNKLGAVASTSHMKMKLPSLDGGVITIKSDQKAIRNCYESSLKSRMGLYSVIVQVREPIVFKRFSQTLKVWRNPMMNQSQRNENAQVTKLF